ncbi:MAG: WYL domain-containing protein [Ruminiclostridium sp.]|nr:WYL domain-containing protein [Ruminiclostridium sp.]
MGKHTDQRDRTLLLARILQEETDDKHPLPLADLVTRLARYGVAAERKSIYRDMAALRKHGLDVTFRAGAGGGWYVGRRDFSSGELRAIIDAVSVYRWLPEEQRKALLDKLAALAPRQQREGLRRPVAVRHRSAAHPDEVRTVIDRIHAALQSRKAISFVPVVYDRDKCRVAAGPRRVVTPKGLIWSGEDYHLLAWDHRDRTLRIYRPDRMDEVVNTGMPAQGPETDAGLWTSVPFGLEPARRERIRLRCCKSLAGEVLDQLGEEAVLVPEGENFTVTADVVVGPRFWGWMAAHGDRAAVIAPSWAAKVWQERYGLGQAPLQAQFKAV